MVGAHSYCFITGLYIVGSVEELRDTVLEDFLDYPRVRKPGKEQECPLAEEIVNGLCYTQDDVEASGKYVMLCGYERDNHGNVKLLAQFEDQGPERPARDNTIAVFNVVAGADSEVGDYYNEDPPEGDPGDYSVFGIAPTMIITQRSYVILRQAVPRLEPHVLFRLNFRKDRYKDIDYGPLNGFQQQWAYWPGIVQEGGSYPQEPIRQIWRNILLNSNKTNDEILYDAWRGAGNMWVLVSPDRFPISNVGVPDMDVASQWSLTRPTAAVFRLSRDILLLIADIVHPRDLSAFMNACKSTRIILRHPAHSIVQRYIKRFEPWFLPAGPFDFPHGHREIGFWNSEWSKVGYKGGDLDAFIPWLDYRRECSHSLSMWSRIRIWRIAQQMDSLADRLGYYDDPTDVLLYFE